MTEIRKLRVVTYNIHKCRGLDQRVRPARIVEVLREIDADIIALQEVLSVHSPRREDHQVSYIAHELGYDYRLGETRMLKGGIYGNVVLSRLPLQGACNFNISVSGREPRGCLRADVELHRERVLHLYNVHLGTAFLERRRQARKLLEEEILSDGKLTGPRIMLGDFNEWTHGLTSRLLSAHFASADIRHHMRRTRTYPGFLPFLHLDHIYFDRSLELVEARLHRSRTALVASDHLPIVADFRLHVESTNGKAPSGQAL